jgi:hypothetical protein
MPEKDPSTWAMTTWLFALIWPVIGGLVNWYSRVRQGHTRAFNLIELVGEIATAGFVGILVFMGVSAYGAPEGIAAAASGIGGHMGTRLLYLAERIIEERVTAYRKPNNVHS